MGGDDRAQRAAASPAVTAGATGLGDLFRGAGTVRDEVVDHVAGDSGTQTDEHLGPLALLIDGHEMGELANELCGVGAEARV